MLGLREQIECLKVDMRDKLDAGIHCDKRGAAKLE